MSNCIAPFSLKDAPALIERLLPVQKLSVEAYKEQRAVHGKGSLSSRLPVRRLLQYECEYYACSICYG